MGEISNMKVKLALPSFLREDDSKSKELESSPTKAEKLWPGVPVSGRTDIYKKLESNYQQEPVLNFDVWTDENVKKTDANQREFYKQALKTGSKEDWGLWKREKMRLKNAMRMARLKNKLKSEPIAECMLPFYCDTCDKGFKSEFELHSHVKEHVKCSRDGCDFVGHPKIVQLHDKMQHRTGLASKINNIKTKEDVAKWRSERKRKFPTSTNIKAKLEKEENDQSRGILLKTKDFGKMRGKKCRSHKQNKTKFQKMNEDKPHKPIKFVEKENFEKSIDEDSVEEKFSFHGFCRFPGLRSDCDSVTETHKVDENFIEDLSVHHSNGNCENVQSNIEDLQLLHVKDTVPSETRLKTANHLQCSDHVFGNLSAESPNISQENNDISNRNEFPKKFDQVTSFNGVRCSAIESNSEPLPIVKEADSYESDSEKPTEMPILKSCPNSKVERSNPPGALGSLIASYATSSEDEAEEDNSADVKSQEVNTISKTSRCKVFPPTFWDPNKINKSKRVKRKSTLLEKMLANEIRHERNVVLQCVKYIIKNNFFDDQR